MNEENVAKLEKIKKALFSIDDDNKEEKEESIIKENKKVVLRGNFRKGLQVKK